MGPDVFIIHAGRDKASALALRDALREVGIAAFVDQPDIRAGTAWATEIPSALRSALIAVVLVGAEDTHYQREEIAQAIDDKRALRAIDRVIPVLLQARGEMPYGLRGLQALAWDPPEAVAAALAARVAAIRGGAAMTLAPRRARWEQRYLDDKAPLWRRGDPALPRAAGGVSDRWYVHLKADFPWVEVDARVHYLAPVFSAADRLPRIADDPRPSSDIGVPPTMMTTIEDRDRRTVRPWLDPLLSHPLLPRVVVVGPAGAGKTALLQHLAWVLATDEVSGACRRSPTAPASCASKAPARRPPCAPGTAASRSTSPPRPSSCGTPSARRIASRGCAICAATAARASTTPRGAAP